MNQLDNMTLEATVQSDKGNSGKREKKRSLAEMFSWPGRVVLLLAVVLAPWMIGSVNPWSQRWLMIALLFSLAFWWFETALNERKKQIFPYLFFPVALGLAIGILQTVTVPTWLGDFFLGRQQEIYQQFSGDAGTRVTISLDREGTWDQIRLLVIAISGLLLGCRYFRSKKDIVLLMTVMAINGVAISFFAIIHKLTAEYSKIYWVFDIGERTEAYGPFVNPNNCAGYLLMCLACAIGLLPTVMSKRVQEGPHNIISKEIPIWRQLYFHSMEFIAELTALKLATLVAMVFISFGVVASLSKGAVVALLVGGIATLFLYGIARKPKQAGFVFVPIIGLVFALSAWIGVGEKIVKRFEQIDMVNVDKADIRLQLWQDMLPSIGEMGPLGSGLGSHNGVHRLYRTIPEDSLFVYAENQYIQAIIEAGWPGLILFLVAWGVLYMLISTLLKEGQSPTTIGVGAMGVFLFFSQAVASIFDFGFYIGANMLLLAVLVGFISYHGQSLANRLKKKSWLNYQLPNYMIQVLLLLLFAGGTMVALNLHQRAKLDVLMNPRAKHFGRDFPALDETESKIADLGSLIQNTPTIEATNYMGELWVHRSRLMQLAKVLEEVPDLGNNSGDTEETKKRRKEEKENFLDRLWARTHIQSTQEMRYFERNTRSKYAEARFINSPAIRPNLDSALPYFEYSRRESPLQSVTHLRLGLIKEAIKPTGAGVQDLERAISLAPFNPGFRELVGVCYLQSGDVKGALPHLARVLEMAPTRFNTLMGMMTGQLSTSVATVPLDVILENVIPDDPDMLNRFAAYYVEPESPVHAMALDKAESLLVNAGFSRRKEILLMGYTCERNGKFEKAAEYFKSALVRQPNDPVVRLKYAKLLDGLERYDEALKEAQKLAKENPQKGAYVGYLRQLETKIRKLKREKQ